MDKITMQQHGEAYNEQAFEMRANGIDPGTFEQWLEQQKRIQEYLSGLRSKPGK